jgi:hypothetical protein
MKAFKSMIVVKHPKKVVWETMRDRLTDMVPFLDDVAAIKEVDRRDPGNGVVRLTNLWKAETKIPAAIRSILHASQVSWLDRAEWFEMRDRCEWQIEPQFFTDHIRCAGITSFEPAIGGRGTRITFEGKLDITLDNIPGVPGFMQGTVMKAIESLVTTLIPKNFQKLTAALSNLLEQQGKPILRQGR